MGIKRLQIFDPTACQFDESIESTIAVIAKLCKRGILKEIVLHYDDDYESAVLSAFKKVDISLSDEDDSPAQK